MNGKVNEDLKAIKFILDKNRPYLFPCVVMLVSIILLFQFVIPQFQALFSAGEQAKNMSLKLGSLKQNLNILTNASDDSLDSQLRIVSLALPSEKDFSGILNAIYFSAQKAGVALGPFSIQIGNLSNSENAGKSPTISLTLPINSDTAGVNNFVAAISKTLPLSDVTLIKIGEVTSTVNLVFYYKPLNVLSNSEDVRLSPVSQKGLSLIDKLATFENSSIPSL
ncbi:MAG: hypothetical protein Q7R51_00645 [bacterium]|nr:hypothetical protein [bacterium]